MTIEEAERRIKSLMRLPDTPLLVSNTALQNAIDQALAKLNQRTGGKYTRSATYPGPGNPMIVLRDPTYDQIQAFAIPFGGGYEGLTPWTLENVDKHQGALRYFLDLAVEYLHIEVAGKYAMADNFSELPFNFDFRGLYDQAVSRISEIDRDIMENWFMPVL